MTWFGWMFSDDEVPEGAQVGQNDQVAGFGAASGFSWGWLIVGALVLIVATKG